MKIVYALDKLECSIFLAGPTPRSPEVPSWRPGAIETLKKLGFDGTVYIPETDDWAQHEEYDHQIAWEWQAIDMASVVVFWIPRNLDTLPGFTTNIEFGYCVNSGKCVLGYPNDTPKIGYLDKLASRHNVPIFNSLYDTLFCAVRRINDAQLFGIM